MSEISWIILPLVTVIITLIMKKAGTTSSNHVVQKQNSVEVFAFPKVIQIIFYFSAVSAPIAFFFGALTAPSKNDISEPKFWVGLVLIITFSMFGGLYFQTKKIVLTEFNIIKRSIFGKLTFPFDQVNKMVIHFSAGNPIAAQAFLYCEGKKMILESLIVDYENLIWDLRYCRLKNATIVEKSK
ncbi:MAG: hypothetical protein ACPGJI_04180 [Kangiellaceae bacterium]